MKENFADFGMVAEIFEAVKFHVVLYLSVVRSAFRIEKRESIQFSI